MEAFALLTVIVGPLLLVIIVVSSRFRQIHLVMSDVLTHYEGRLQFGLSRPRVQFQAFGQQVDVYISLIGGESLEVVTLHPESQLSCEIRPRRTFDGLRSLLGKSSVVTGLTGFDRSFFVVSNDPARMRSVLDATAQAALLSIYQNKVRVTLKHGRINICGKVFTGKPRQTLWFVEQSMRLVESLLGLGEGGVEFLDDDSEWGRPMISVEASCPVCGEPLDGSVVYCAGCEMPHHKECWSYAGSCAIFGCGHSKSRRQPSGSRT